MTERVLAVLNSVTMMDVNFLLIMAALGIVAYEMLTLTTDSSDTILFYVDGCITLFFVIEVVMRFTCRVIVDGSVLPYLTDVHNLFDLSVVLIDIPLILAIFIGQSRFDGASKWIKAMRFARILSFLWGGMQLVGEAASLSAKKEKWTPPVRFTNTSPHEVKTMIKVVQVLSSTQRIVEDRMISLFMTAFQNWENGKDSRSPPEIFESVVSSRELTLERADFIDIFLDTLMFENAELMQNALDVIVAQYSQHEILLRNASHLQLLVSKKREKQFGLVDQMLLQLERNSETQELWGALQTEEDRLVSAQTHDIIDELINLVRVRRMVLEFDEQFAPEPQIQSLYHNLGFFEIAFKVFGLMDSIDEDEFGNLDEAGQNTKDLVKKCSELMYWFLLENKINQELGFTELDHFINTLDDSIGSDKVIRAIFKNNESTMRKCPKSAIQKVVEKICVDGQKPEYLALLCSVTHVGDLNIVENQYEVVQQLAAPMRLAKCMKYFVPVTGISSGLKYY